MTIDGVKIMNKQWMGHTEAFYKECFIYLKAKFSNKRPKAVGGEIYTEQPIYNETIVALEQIHNVLTKIENGSAYTREDYDDSVIKKDADKTKEIIDFFKVLGLTSSDEMASAFDNFHKYYYWDSKIYRYKKFLHSPEEMKDWDLTERNMWSLENFDAEIFFNFLDRYKSSIDSSPVLSDEEEQKADWINEKIAEQNTNYERLLSSYDDLLDQKVKFGVSVFDVYLPSSLNDLSDPNVRFFSSKFVAEFGCYMDREFGGDDGVLLVINHAHVVSHNTFALSYLVIYKIKNYDSQEKLVEHYSKKIYAFVDIRKAQSIKVIDREQMIKKIYPSDHFIGELRGQKQKIDFREKFLRYFLSSVFLLDVDKGAFLEEYENYYSIFFNHFRFFKEKIYVEPKPQKAHISLFQQLVENKVFLSDLLDDRNTDNLDKYFYLRDLTPQARERIEIIEFLYRQQASILECDEHLLEDLIRIEKFLTQLMFLRRVNAFETEKIQKGFNAKPSFLKLTVLFRQFILILEMSCFKNASHVLGNYSSSKGFQSKDLRSEAIRFLKKFNNDFPQPVRIDSIQMIKEKLHNYQNSTLQVIAKDEKVAFKKAKKHQVSIKNYLEQVLQKGVIVLRFIFTCGAVGQLDKAKTFNEMFQDYIDNLKRRHTAGVCLVDHVGIYVPYSRAPYIDATLFFEYDEKKEIEPNTLKKEVADYWIEYVVRKSEQIQTYIQKQKKTNNMTNAFECFRDEQLSARSVNVLRTEGPLNEEYVEVFPNQRKNKQLLMESISKFYAYGSLILVDDADRNLLPRKDCLIVGRKRKSQEAKDKKEGGSKPTAGEASGHKSDIQIPTLSNVETSAFETPKSNEQYCTEDGSVDTSGSYENSSNMLALEQDKKILEPIPSVVPEVKAEQADISKADVGNKFIGKTVIVRSKARAIAKLIVK